MSQKGYEEYLAAKDRLFAAVSRDQKSDPAMGWHEQRVIWNNEGRCAREACGGSIKRRKWWNKGSNLHYCTRCAVEINKYSEGGPLCTEVERAHPQPEGEDFVVEVERRPAGGYIQTIIWKADY